MGQLGSPSTAYEEKVFKLPELRKVFYQLCQQILVMRKLSKEQKQLQKCLTEHFKIDIEWHPPPFSFILNVFSLCELSERNPAPCLFILCRNGIIKYSNGPHETIHNTG